MSCSTCEKRCFLVKNNKILQKCFSCGKSFCPKHIIFRSYGTYSNYFCSKCAKSEKQINWQTNEY